MFMTGEAVESANFTATDDFHKESLRQAFGRAYMEACELLAFSGISTSIYLSAYEDHLRVDTLPSHYCEGPESPLPWHHGLIAGVALDQKYLPYGQVERAFETAWERMKRYIRARVQDAGA